MEEEDGGRGGRGARTPGAGARVSTERQRIYIKMLEDMAQAVNFTLTVDAEHIFEFDAGLYAQLIDYPAEIIPLFDSVLARVFLEVCPVSETQAEAIA